VAVAHQHKIGHLVPEIYVPRPSWQIPPDCQRTIINEGGNDRGRLTGGV